ncbi:MAG: glycosyltransferase family 2 protein [Lachnospiraceae bacterium]|nr:glycosyltransferase family 2 protein [Lachnospiraceae bacterium]
MVSVVVPVYKSEETLERCVNSLLAQTYTDMEILLVVEGAPDASGILADRLAALDDRIRVLNRKNEGVSASRNHGIAGAKGKYIRFVDSDDYVQPDSVEMLVRAIEETDCDLVIAGYNHRYFGREIPRLPETVSPILQGADPWEKHDRSEEEYLYKLYHAGFLNMPWNKLFKRELIREEFPRELNLGEDLLFNLAYLKQVKTFSVVSAPVYEYIQDDRGTTLSTKRRENKLTLTMQLYGRVCEAFRALFPGHKENCALRDKLVKEFLDDVEELAFENAMGRDAKKSLIRTYEDQLSEVLRDAEEKIHLHLLDYKIIYFFMKRKQTNLVYLMVYCRGVIVRLLRKR